MVEQARTQVSASETGETTRRSLPVAQITAFAGLIQQHVGNY